MTTPHWFRHNAGEYPEETMKSTQRLPALPETLGIGAHAVDRAQVQRGETALVIGAGPIGLSVVQFLQEAGALIVVLDINEQRQQSPKPT